jgi:two-component system sensor histidine kinase PilS (NtrC family)
MMQETPIAPEARDTFWRTLLTFSVTRIVIALVLLLFLGINAVREPDAIEFFIDWRTCLIYLLIALLFALVARYWRRRFMVQLLIQVFTDIAVISFLYIAAGGARSGLAILYLFPLAGCAIMVSLTAALSFVSIVTLILLAETSYQLLNSLPDASPSRAGLYGAAFFAAIFVINRLAAKLIKQENLAAQRGRHLQLQEAINRIVIADMGDGILVVGRDTEVFAGNPAAERMLGLSFGADHPRKKLREIASLRPIAEAFAEWMERSSAPDTVTRVQAELAPTFVRVKPVSALSVRPGEARELRRDLVAHLRLNFAKVDASSLPKHEDRTVIFLQDVSEIENQAQQLKLASMGRLTASIAHEVRNPLSAIGHAASLLREEATDPTQLRLLNIVGDNVVRLNRMIEDILKLSRKAHTQSEPLQLSSFFEEILSEFRETHGIRPGLIDIGDMRGYHVRFDPLHLREVVVNLLSNALRYASGSDGSIRITGRLAQRGRLELHVQDDGPAITPEVRAHLFEPFYTTSSKGTGLGLYLARELCLNNGAMLDYEYRMDLSADGNDAPSGRFVITCAAAVG